MSVKRAVVPALLLSCGAVLLATVSGAPGAPQPRSRPSPKASPAGPADPWKEVDRLLAEQKFEAASAIVTRLREEARARKDEDAWTRALVRETQIRTALHGYETAVRFLREQPWPEGALGRATLELFYGQSLVHYLQVYSWEIRNRERVESKDPVDLKRWTAEQIGAEAQRAYARVWAQREALGAQPAARLGEFLKRGTYPDHIRGTVRDVVSYLMVELLGNTAHWSPAQHETYRLEVAALLGPVTAPVDDPAAHPLTKVAAVLTDLEGWHGAAGRPEAALEARLERIRRLHALFTDAEDRRRLREDLERRLAPARNLEWWAAGQEVLAELTTQEDTPDALVRARAIAQAGADAYPQSVGGQRCRAVVARIEAPHYQLTAMTLDGPRQRSIQVQHKNLPRLHLRAYAVDLVNRLRTSRDYNMLPAWREIPELLKTARPAAEWTADLAATPDFRNHVTYLTPPLDRPGLYVVVASARPDFPRGADVDNQLQAVNLVVSDLVLVHRNLGDALEVTATSGRTGGPLAGAVIELWRLDWQKGHQVAATQTTDASGTVRLAPSRSTQFAVLGRHRDHVSLTGHVNWNVTPPLPTRHSSLVYTDRSVYRPGQRLLWKVVAYEGGGEESRFHTSAGAAVEVTLKDANDDVVETKKVTTNTFGSAAGEFQVPPGRLLGEWSVWSTVKSEEAARAAVRVEEYKRPTFEVSLLDPDKEVRLNQPAELTGEARYYFGLPVTTGKVAWRVTRQAVQPWWLWWRHFDTRSRVVASGETALAADGRFKVAFTPEADSRASKELTWSYELSADVTDEGGETRSAQRRFRLGFVSVEAQVTDVPGFVLADQKASLSILRTDLDGTPRAGAAGWTLYALQQPGRTPLPAEQPTLPPTDKAAGGHRTPGDALRPRHQPDYQPERALALWPDGAAVTQGSLQHDAKGVAVLELGPLKAGAYRLRYESNDTAGATFRMAKELVVAQARGTSLALPGILAVERSSVPVGGTARLFVHSGLEGQAMTVELWRSGRRTEVRRLVTGRDPQVLEIPVGPGDRGGFGVSLTLVRDHQLVYDSSSVFVPWSDRELKVGFATFRDRLRPGDKETWRVTVSSADPGRQPIAAAEVLAYMYDRSLDLFQRHEPPSALGLYPNRTRVGSVQANLGGAGPQWQDGTLGRWAPGPTLTADRLDFWSGYGLGGPGRRVGGVLAKPAPAGAHPPPPPPASIAVSDEVRGARRRCRRSASAVAEKVVAYDLATVAEEKGAGAAAPVPLRTQFSETAFWQPQLLTGPDGSATFEFTVPDSVTSWTVWTHALTRDLRAGSDKRETRSVKDLMVRPYLPRFLREGDQAEIKIVVNNASTSTLTGEVTLEIQDPATQRDLGPEFGLQGGRNLAFQAPPSGSANVTVTLTAPRRLEEVAVKVVARAGDLSDGEQRPLPVLPSRIHLIESRFATLKGATSRTLTFPALARTDDPTRQTEQLVVTLDGQLFYGVLESLPYLVNYPYECTEQTLNRFVSTGIVSSLFTQYPAVARMAREMSARDTQLEVWDKDDPNRRMLLEETPWAAAARGGAAAEKDLVKVLDPKIARATREEALAKLEKAQTSSGGFPWFPGGPPSPYMTLYITYSLSKAREFGVDVPQEMVKKSFVYLHQHYLDEWVRESIKGDRGWEFVTFLGYVLTAYPGDDWTGGVFTEAERKKMLDFSFKHWKEHTPYLKGYLALTLHRRGRPRDAALVWDSVMDSAKTDADTGTSWAPEDRAWLWYNDTIETHAFALRTLGELKPKDPRREGLVQWLFLHKKLNHWSSTRATAEVLYALAHYLKQEGQLGVREEATVKVGSLTERFVFEPDRYTGKHNRLVVPGGTVDAEKTSAVVVEKATPGMMFASATWHYATDRLPDDEAGDLFGVSRRYFRRENKDGNWTLTPLAEGTALVPGDEVEVHLSLRARQAAEYVHLRDPRGAGFEPVTLVSGFKWDTGLGFYEEVRDSGENFFFEWLPAGEYTFKYRVRAAHAGTFRVGPAQVQSMYAPEFAARSAGHTLGVQPAK